MLYTYRRFAIAMILIALSLMLFTCGQNGKDETSVDMASPRSKLAQMKSKISAENRLSQEFDVEVFGTILGGEGNDVLFSIVETAEGEYVAAGYTDARGAGMQDLWVVKVSAMGQLLWEKTYGGKETDKGECIRRTPDGGFIIAGRTESEGAGKCDAWLVKLDKNGELVWQKTFGGDKKDWAKSIVVDKKGDYMVLGTTWSKGAGKSDFWVFKVNKDGTLIWEKTYGGPSWDDAQSMIQTTEGGYAIAGNTQSIGALGSDIWFLKLDADGELVLDKKFGGEKWDVANDLIQTEDGFLIAGSTRSNGEGDYDFWPIRIDVNGTIMWEKYFGGTQYDMAESIVSVIRGKYAIVGVTQSKGEGRSDAYLVIIDEFGMVTRERTYGGTGLDEAYSVIQSADEHLVICGATTSGTAGEYNGRIMKVDLFVEPQKLVR